MEIGNGNGISASAGSQSSAGRTGRSEDRSRTDHAHGRAEYRSRHDRLGDGLLSERCGFRDLRGVRRSVARRSYARADRGRLHRASGVVERRAAGSRQTAPAAAFLATRGSSASLAATAAAGGSSRDRRPPAGATPAGRNCAASRKRRCPVVSVERRPPRIPRTIASDLAGWLHRVRTVHGWLHSGVNVYARPETAGGRSLAGDNHAARAAAGDRSLLHDLLTRSVEELEAVRDEVWKAMQPGPLTSQPGTPERINELARRVAAGQTLHTESDRRRWC